MAILDTIFRRRRTAEAVPATAETLAQTPATSPAPAPADDSADVEHTSYADLHPERKIFTMIGVLLAMLLAALDQTIVGTALPRIVRDLGGADHLTWVVTAYMLASTVAVPIYGKLSDLYGRKWFFFSGIVLFLIGSVLCGLSHSMLQLIIFRALQGIGGGAIMGNAFAIISDLFVPAERAKWQGAMGGIFGLASVIGPALGGWLTDHASWHWVFYINLPLGLVALGVIAFLMPKVVPHIEDKAIDYAGAFFLAATLVPLLLALSWGGRQYAWGSVQVVGSLIGSAAALLGFLWAESRAKHPIIPLSLFNNRVFTVSVTVTFLTGAAMFGAIVYIPLFGQLVQGISATNSGTILTPLMVGLIGASIVAGQIISRTGKYRWLALASGALLSLSLLWLAQITSGTGEWALIERMLALGLSLGISMPIFTITVQSAFDQTFTGVVTASVQLARSVGGTVGTAILGAIFNNTLAQNATGLATTAYAQAASAKGINAADPNVIQGLLSSEGQAKVHAAIAALPAPTQATATNMFAGYLTQAKDAFAGAVAHVFLIGAIIAAVALIVTLALKEIPLRQGHGKPAEPGAPGDQLAAELGQAEPKDEPALLH